MIRMRLCDKMSWNIILFGDSDISRWPPSVYPSSFKIGPKASNYGESGAELTDVLHQTVQWKLQIEDGTNNIDNDNETANNLFVCCAGENDIGSGRSLDLILETFRAVLDALFPADNDSKQQLPSNKSKMIFFGPKFEPWLADDNTSRKQYTKLNNGFQRIIRKHQLSNQIKYIDCLTLFCTKDSATLPGAIYGGKAMADNKYFDADGLHLNDKGYGVWRQMVEETFVDWSGE
mmetsp:Transcript_27793/g.52377  ORF Transcript_27793/g.52377 Transcript_27793/m.52377 type:complete len:233 (-) Transcript_27793:1430-2128(-)